MKRNRAAQPKLRSTTQRRGRRTKPFWASGSLCGLVSRVALIDKNYFDRLFRDSLNLASQFCNLSAILFIGRRHTQSQQMPQRVHSHRGLLRRLLEDPAEFEPALCLFLGQHARLHSTRMEDGADGSFEDEVFRGLSEADTRRIPPGGEHSIAWLIWHIARCEDVTLNLLVHLNEALQVKHRLGAG